MAVTKDLPHFKRSELKHPELVNARAFRWLNEIREEFGEPLVITDDGRPVGVKPSGAPLDRKSLHELGQAFDLRTRNMTREQLWRFDGAVRRVADRMPSGEAGIELELVSSAKDKHAHVGFFLDGRANRLIIAAD